MSERTIKYIIFFLIVFALQGVLLLVLMLNPARAGAAGAQATVEQNITNCPCGFSSDKPTDKLETVRLFIPIPGVTDKCGYLCDVNGDSRADVVDYVIMVYKFLVGLAGVVAVIMIMLGGYRWIFAMGNSARIAGAKETIFSAIIGLVLALISVQLLETINPRLADVSLPNVAEIGRVSLSEEFCSQYDILSTDVDFNTALVAKSLNLVPATATKGPSAFVLRDIKGLNLFSGDDDDAEGTKHEILRCDNQAANYKIQGSPPTGPEVKIARIDWREPKLATDVGSKEITGVECFYGLCSDQSNLGLSKTQILQNKEFLLEYVKNFKKNNIAGEKYSESVLTIDDVHPNTSTSTAGDGACYGTYCDLQEGEDNLTLCVRREQFGLGCVSPKTLCQNQPVGSCSEVNDAFTKSLKTQGLPFACGKRSDPWYSWWYTLDMGRDNCDLGTKFKCPTGWSVSTSFVGVDQAKGKCWEQDKDMPKLKNCAIGENDVFPILSGDYAVENVNAICCVAPNHDQYQCVSTFADLFKVAATGTSVEKNIGAYTSLSTVDYPKGPYHDCKTKIEGDACIVYAQEPADADPVFTSGKCQFMPVVNDPDATSFPEDQRKLVCQDERTQPLFKVKLCYRGTDDNVVYRKYEDCTLRNDDSCKAFIMPDDYPCFKPVGKFNWKLSGVDEGHPPIVSGGAIAGNVTAVRNAVLVGHINNVMMAAVPSPGFTLRNYFTINTLQLGFQKKSRWSPIKIASAAVGLDACRVVAAIIAIESGGKADAIGYNKGSVDCGLMQKNVDGGKSEESCRKSSFGNLFDEETSIKAGVEVLNGSFFKNPLGVPKCGDYHNDPGDKSACEMAANDPVPNQVFWPYLIMQYNGGLGASKRSFSCVSGTRKMTCAQLKEAKAPRTCFYDGGAGNYWPTMVECPYDNSGNITDAYNNTYGYVQAFKTSYEKVDAPGPNRPNCP
ncbi:MAG: hypothetical protein A2445_00050 [Candidatus Jacksonbacteria bacterium RIFOXYC2_FULL_44_29]|nr:MAG: hypothetical protein A2295_01550 [Candidatus Jacksonbacteria bacterium RIFOXYB2_FULL_44_15]OGY80237.1 MAG: hypothetical protein A2445_00050 [Candidatus Jacksonbacteria bacterium RIFOXYC2_FULL_44_29]OGY82149.1 MAG: hypothetical protein A2550_02975 [Candidatus Jacksonbacteria bacterium RIFOXYD2_FULL_43_21]HBH46770.1 hypothetical protein [Candidatus Jacksonbacteria bacterium]HCC49887.1 hypothetical protein [Candidatus Jacksonbacteria bacterium]